MTSDKDLERLVGRALLDEAFRRDLFADPRSAARSAGVELTDEQVERLRALGPGTAKVLASYVLKKPMNDSILNLWHPGPVSDVTLPPGGTARPPDMPSGTTPPTQPPTI